MKEKVSIITGASGEIGQNLILEFEKLNNKKIVAIDLKQTIKSKCIYKFYQKSILDQSVLSKLNEEYIIEEIYHFAAVLSTKAEKNPGLAEDVNIQGSINLFNLALSQYQKNNILTKIFFPSSIAVYNINSCSNKDELISEETYCNPSTVYGKHKLFCENLGTSFEKYGNQTNAFIDFRCIRFPGIISANSMPTGGTSDYAPELIHNAYNKNNYTSFVNKNTRLPFIVMPDAINAIVQIMETHKENLNKNAYNIKSFSPTLNELSLRIKTKFPDFLLSYNIDKMRQSIVDGWPNFINDNAAKDDWGWSPKYNLESAFIEYIQPILEK